MNNTTIPNKRPNYAPEVRQRAVAWCLITKVITRRAGPR